MVFRVDSAAEPQLVGADLLVEAEHGPEALPVPVITSADAGEAALAEQLVTLPPRDVAPAALANVVLTQAKMR